MKEKKGDMAERTISEKDGTELLEILKKRFEVNMQRHNNLKWELIELKLKAKPEKLWSLNQMELTGGEPDVVGHDAEKDSYIFYDCSPESPKERRSYCYDRLALESRKKYPPENNALDVAALMGISLLNEEEYRNLQQTGAFDLKTSCWIQTPESVRKLGGALFCDRRYDTVFVYHNGADSYYSSRGFRGKLEV